MTSLISEPTLTTQAPRSLWKTRLLRTKIPFVLLLGVLVVSLVSVFTQAHLYAVTVDESPQQTYGQAVLAWYQSHGANKSFLTVLPPTFYEPEHGGGFQALVDLIEHGFSQTNIWLVRHTVTGLAGWLGFVAMALCGYAIGGPWIALAAAVGLWLFPRYTGAMWNNPKDVPAASSYVFLIWATILLAKNWQYRLRSVALGVLVGVTWGAAIAIRVNSLSWLGVLVVLLAGWWVVHGGAVLRARTIAATLVQQASVALALAGTTLGATMLLWPFAFLNPIANVWKSIVVLAHYLHPGGGPLLRTVDLQESASHVLCTRLADR